MPRAKQQTAFLGEQTVRILLAVPQKQAGWLIHALCDWIENDREPDPAKIPPACIGAWVAIRDESIRIHESRKQLAAAGKEGAKVTNGKGAANERQTDGEPPANDRQKGGKSKSKNENSLSSESSFSAPAPACEISRTDPGADFTPSYIVEDWAALKMQAHNVGLTDDQLAAWRDYYAAQGWRFKPAYTTPMTRTAALASIRNWARAEKRLEIRAMRRDPSKFAPPPEKGGIDTAALGI